MVPVFMGTKQCSETSFTQTETWQECVSVSGDFPFEKWCVDDLTPLQKEVLHQSTDEKTGEGKESKNDFGEKRKD